MGLAAESKPPSYADYLALEQETGLKHQWIDGEVFAMTGGTPDHALVTGNFAVLVGMALRGRPCRLYSSDLKLRASAVDMSSYPDLSVIWGPRQPDPQDPNALVNPTLIVEVLSPGTEAFDRGDKFRRYRTLPALQDYVLVSTERVLVEVYTRDGDAGWRLREYIGGEALRLPSLELALPVDEIYEGTALIERLAAKAREG